MEAAEPQKHFTKEEEDVLAGWCTKLIEWGHPPRVDALRTLASGLLQAIVTINQYLTFVNHLNLLNR